MTGPIKPSEVAKRRNNTIPQEVFDAFNDLILTGWNGASATVLENEVAVIIARKLKVTLEHTYANHWLDVESAFEKAGWEVDYDAPAFNESYKATFTFSKKSKL